MSFYDVVYEQVKKFRTARLQPTDKSLVFAVLRGHRAQWGMLCISTPIQSTCLVLEWSIVSEDVRLHLRSAVRKCKQIYCAPTV